MTGADPFMNLRGDCMWMSIRLRIVEPAIRTKYNNDFYGEPDEAVSKAVELEFVPRRATWD